MLKIRKSKIKLIGVISCISLLSLGYVGLSFYSIPEKVSAAEEVDEWRTLNDITYMQEMNKYICENSKVGDNNILIDNRGGGYDNGGIANSYTIVKLHDDTCWMTQNLKFDIGVDEERWTNADTDLSDGRLWPDVKAIKTLSAASWANDANAPYYNNDPRALKTSSNYRNEYGYYYNWCAATAGTCTSSGEAADSICPRGWRLPTSNKASTVSGSFNKLIADASPAVANVMAAPYNFKLGGYVGGESLNNAGVEGTYWSSTSNGADNAYILHFGNNGGYNPSYSGVRYGGLSIRCITNEQILESDNLSGPTTSTEETLSVKVANVITIDAISGMQEEATSAKITTGNITATVATNATSYQVLLSAEQTDLVSKNAENTHVIPASTEIVVNKNGWGILNEDATYAAITNKPTPYYNTRTTGEDIIGVKHVFGVGISVTSTLPADTYSTNVTITAAAV